MYATNSKAYNKMLMFSVKNATKARMYYNILNLSMLNHYKVNTQILLSIKNGKMLKKTYIFIEYFVNNEKLGMIRIAFIFTSLTTKWQQNGLVRSIFLEIELKKSQLEIECNCDVKMMEEGINNENINSLTKNMIICW